MTRFLLLFLTALLTSTAHAQVVDRIVAVVNNEPILESDVTLLRDRAKRPFLLFELLLENDPQNLTKGDRKNLLDYLVGEKVLQSEIKRLGLDVSLDKVEQEIRDIARRNNVSVNEIYSSFKQEGLSVSEYQELMRSKMERDALLGQEVISKIRISDDDALAEYMRRHPDARLAVNEFTVAHIFFDPKKAGGAEAAYNRAQDALSKLRDGENFETLAEKVSEDSNFSPGGVLGTFKAGEFLKEIEDRVSSLSAGEVSTVVVQSRIGFHIVKVISKKLAPDPRFAREKENIRRQLENQAIRRQFRVWLQAKKDDSFIRMNDVK